MPFRLSLWYKGKEVVACEDPTDDGVVAIWNCRQYQEQVFPVMKKLPYFKRVKEGDIERRVSRIVDQLSLPIDGMNGKHT